jgi:hypothetical protein
MMGATIVPETRKAFHRCPFELNPDVFTSVPPGQHRCFKRKLHKGRHRGPTWVWIAPATFVVDNITKLSNVLMKQLVQLHAEKVSGMFAFPTRHR